MYQKPSQRSQQHKRGGDRKWHLPVVVLRKIGSERGRERAADLAPLLADPNSHFYVCGLKAMEEGVVLALRDVAAQADLDWDGVIGPGLKREGRLHLETY